MTEHEIKVNFPELLQMLGEQIYAEPDMAIREMIQNAHDTCIIRKTVDPTFINDPEIHITFDRYAQTLTIADPGAGMTEEELHQNLATIGESFTRVQRDQLRGVDPQAASLLIGQFGIGLLSAFSVSDRVEFLTRSYKSGATGCRWVCKGDIHYTVEPFDKEEPGTRVVLHILDSKRELLGEKRLRQAIKKYADFLSVPILLNGTKANVCTPAWEADKKTPDLAEYIRSRWDIFPLSIIPFNTASEKGNNGKPLPNISGVLFVPMIPFEVTRDFGEIDIYISRMFIKANDKDLLPRWARFVKGVINTPDLTPTLSRGEIITDYSYNAVRDLLGTIILYHLEMLEKQDPEKLTLLVGAYNNTIKAEALNDDAFFDCICDVVRVSTDLGHITISKYLEKSGNKIYYFAERGSGTQQKVLFSHKGLPVVDASWGVEESFLERYAERRGVAIERLAAGAGTIFKPPETIDEKWRALERAFQRRVKKEARAVEFEPDMIPAVLVTKPMDEDNRKLAQMDMLIAQLGLHRSASIRQILATSNRAAEEDTVLHLNTKNTLMQRLRELPQDQTFDLAITCIYNNALMFCQHYISPEDAELIFSSNNTAFSAMIASAQELSREQQLRAKVEMERDQLKRRLPPVDLTEFRSCFFAFDYKIEDNFRILRWLQEYFRKPEFGIMVLAPAHHIDDLNILTDLHRQLKSAHFGIADVSNNNRNVLYEAGLIHGMGKPLILLQEKNSGDAVPFDIFSDFRVKYEVSRLGADIRFTWLQEELDKAMKAVFRMRPELEKTPKCTD